MANHQLYQTMQLIYQMKAYYLSFTVVKIVFKTMKSAKVLTLQMAICSAKITKK